MILIIFAHASTETHAFVYMSDIISLYSFLPTFFILRLSQLLYEVIRCAVISFLWWSTFFCTFYDCCISPVGLCQGRGVMPYWPHTLPGWWITWVVIHCDRQIIQTCALGSTWLVPLISRACPVWYRPLQPAQPMSPSSALWGGANCVPAAASTEVIMGARRWCGASTAPNGCMLTV